eukprot:7822-Heterococcus_DN1.PRE.2
MAKCAYMQASIVEHKTSSSNTCARAQHASRAALYVEANKDDSYLIYRAKLGNEAQKRDQRSGGWICKTFHAVQALRHCNRMKTLLQHSHCCGCVHAHLSSYAKMNPLKLSDPMSASTPLRKHVR